MTRSNKRACLFCTTTIARLFDPDQSSLQPPLGLRATDMEILYLLLPLSLAIVALIGALLWWAVFSGQYDEVEQAGLSILHDNDRTFI
jgi:cbb3-type cytochrome oxidase maturation protein